VVPGLTVALMLGSLLIGPYVGSTSGHIGESAFASVVEPIGVAATPGRLLVTHPFCGDPREVLSLDSSGAVSVFATLPPLGSACVEMYVAVASPADPSRPGFPSPTRGGFLSNFVYVTQGPKIFKISPAGAVSLFVTIASCSGTQTGITFDRVGTFGYAMLVTCDGGTVWKVTAGGTVTQVADVAGALKLKSVRIENPDVAPSGFAPYGGQLLVAAEVLGQVLAVASSGAVSTVASWDSAEGVNFIPSTKCIFGTSGGTFFTAIFRPAGKGPGTIYQFPLTSSTFLGKSGRTLVTSESGEGIALLSSTPPGITVNLFHETIGQHQGSTFVDCAVPLLLKIIVKPGSIPHTINPASAGTVPVAILSSPIFNALTQTVVSSIRFGFTGTEDSIEFCNKSGEDVNGDGLLDLICHATTTKLGIPTQGVYRGPLILKMHYNAPGGDPDAEGGD
jgi:hypothetical protein